MSQLLTCSSQASVWDFKFDHPALFKDLDGSTAIVSAAWNHSCTTLRTLV